MAFQRVVASLSAGRVYSILGSMTFGYSGVQRYINPPYLVYYGEETEDGKTVKTYTGTDASFKKDSWQYAPRRRSLATQRVQH